MAKLRSGDQVIVLNSSGIPSEWQGLEGTVLMVCGTRAPVTRITRVLPPQDQWEIVYAVQPNQKAYWIPVRESWLSPVKSK